MRALYQGRPPNIQTLSPRREWIRPILPHQAFIVRSKSAHSTARFWRTAARSDAGSAWSVGNSLASDINTALSCEIQAIWIDAPVWEFERREDYFGNR